MGKLVLIDELDDTVVIEPSLEDLIEEFRYKIASTDAHKEILTQMDIYYKNNEKFQKNKNREAARRARKALLKLFHLVRQRRIEMLEIYKAPDFYDFRK